MPSSHRTQHAIEVRNDWGDTGGLAAVDRPRAPLVLSGPETEIGREYRSAFLRSHSWLRAELDEIRDITARAAAGEIDDTTAKALLGDFALVQHRWDIAEFCAGFCRVLDSHHRREDREMFPAVLRAVPDLSDVVARLRAEHVVIADAVDRLQGALAPLTSSAPAGTSSEASGGVSDAVDDLTALLLSHLAYEEDQLYDGLGRVTGVGR